MVHVRANFGDSAVKHQQSQCGH